MQQVYLSWDRVDELVNKIVVEIRQKKIKYDFLIGIARGGLVPSVLLSHALEVPLGVLTVTHYDGKKMLDTVKKDLYISGIKIIKSHHKILIIDDIADSGICLQESIKTVKKVDSDAKNIDTATLFYKPKSIIKPTYYGQEIENDEWVNFCWEISGAKEKHAVRT